MVKVAIGPGAPDIEFYHQHFSVVFEHRTGMNEDTWRKFSRVRTTFLRGVNYPKTNHLPTVIKLATREPFKNADRRRMTDEQYNG